MLNQSTNLSVSLSLSLSLSLTSATLAVGGESGSVSKEIVLSVGRVFHILSLSEPVIRVKSYSPRHPFPRTSYHYTYRFRVPDSPAGFDTSCTQFTCEPLELYRWNYVDQYLSTRGEDRTFRLQESLKYWRSRFGFCVRLSANRPYLYVHDKYCTQAGSRGGSRRAMLRTYA